MEPGDLMFITTVIPTYNRSADVAVAVESALGQRYPRDRHEVIVVDDGSTDDTPEVLSRYGDAIRTLRVPNGGVAAARNHGIVHARGEAIAFLDSDDTWDPDKLALQAEVLATQPEIAMVLTSMKIVDASGRMKEIYSRRRTLPVDGNVLPYVLRNPSMTPSSAMVRTEVARELTGFDPRLKTAEDLDFHLRLALRHGVAVIDQPLLRYTRADGSLGDSVRSYHDYMLVLHRFIAAHADELDRRTVREALHGAYVRNGHGLATHGEIAGALRFGLGGLRHSTTARDAMAVATVALQLARTLAARTWQRITRGGRLRRSAR
jgi:glycosyltransferase involved in cell wall biosynthesis